MTPLSSLAILSQLAHTEGGMIWKGLSRNELTQGHHTTGPDVEDLFHELDKVLDPELDESILKLGFVESLQVEGGQVIAHLHLPTFWCAASFVYLMANDIRARLATVAGVERVTVRMGNHFASDLVEEGVNVGKSFVETFPGEASDNLESLRAIFLRKGLFKRQERFLRCLLDAGLSYQEVCALRVGNVRLDGESCIVASGSGELLWSGPVQPIRRYLERCIELGFDTSPEAPLFTDLGGRPVTPDQLQRHLKSAQLVRTSLEANTFLCEALLSARESHKGLSGKPNT